MAINHRTHYIAIKNSVWGQHSSYCRATVGTRPLGSLSAVGLRRPHQTHLSDPLMSDHWKPLWVQLMIVCNFGRNWYSFTLSYSVQKKLYQIKTSMVFVHIFFTRVSWNHQQHIKNEKKMSCATHCWQRNLPRLLLLWINLQNGWLVTSIIKCETKIRTHYQTSSAKPFGSGLVIYPHTLLGMVIYRCMDYSYSAFVKRPSYSKVLLIIWFLDTDNPPTTHSTVHCVCK